MKAEPNSDWPQPLTFGGVAQFARASTGRLLLFQTVAALFAAGAAAFFFESAWVPVLTQTIRDLPPSGAIQDRQLTWNRPAPLRTANSRFLWISIDPGRALEPSEGADLQVEFRRTNLRCRSLFGYLAIPYPAGYTIAMNRGEVEPWWGAWHPAVTLGLSAATFIGLFVVWAVLALLYTWPVRLISFYADREVSWPGAWRLASAALLPGAVFFALALLAYTWRQLNLVQFLAAGILHLMIGWIYALFAPFCLPRRPDAARGLAANPFARSSRSDRSNPFAGPSDKGQD
jgi:FtsH-binding integral membrane protein